MKTRDVDWQRGGFVMIALLAVAVVGLAVAFFSLLHLAIVLMPRGA